MEKLEIKSEVFKHKFIRSTVETEEPLLTIGLHGLGDSYNGYLWLPQELNIPEMNFLLINAPDDYYGGYSWFDFEGDQKSGIIRSRKLLLDLLNEIKQQGIKLENVFFFGFSQGCLMIMDLGLRVPEKLAGICGVSGYIGVWEDYPKNFSEKVKEQTFFATHGYHDPIISFTSAAEKYAGLQKLGLNLEFKGYEKVHTIVPQEISDISQWFIARINKLK